LKTRHLKTAKCVDPPPSLHPGNLPQLVSPLLRNCSSEMCVDEYRSLFFYYSLKIFFYPSKKLIFTRNINLNFDIKLCKKLLTIGNNTQTNYCTSKRFTVKGVWTFTSDELSLDCTGQTPFHIDCGRHLWTAFNPLSLSCLLTLYNHVDSCSSSIKTSLIYSL